MDVFFLDSLLKTCILDIYIYFVSICIMHIILNNVQYKGSTLSIIQV